MPAPGPESNFWRGRRVLVTGHTGFKGAWTALWLHRLGADVTGFALPPRERCLFRLLRLDELMPSHFIDLRDADRVAAAVAEARPELVMHMTAQTLVQRSLTEPAESFAINVLGTVNLLNALRTSPGLRAVLVVTTDKVYADDADGRAHPEQDRLGGRDPYSASKAACELATSAMAQSFFAPQGIPVATARASNVIGGGDFAPFRLVPDAVNAALAGQRLTLRNPYATRHWQYVLDCINGYLSYLAALTIDQSLPPALNFGPGTPHGPTVGEIATIMLEALGVRDGWDYAPVPQVKETFALALDSTLSRRILGWSDRLPGRLMIEATAAWYRAWAQGEDMRAVTSGQIGDYEALP